MDDNDDNPQTISMEEFNQVMKKCWHLFHGENTSMEIPSSWYDYYKSGFPEPNNRQGILKNCLNVLIWDCELNMWDPGTYNIRRLAEKHVQQLEHYFSDAQVFPTALTGFEPLMRSNSSHLQQAILGPVAARYIVAYQEHPYYIPTPMEWSPNLSFLPFHAFQAHIFWMAKDDQYTPENFKDLDVNIFKLRYAEYLALSLNTQNKKQFLLGIFTAYGPDVTGYPVRVLQLLKKLELLSPHTILDNLIGSMTTSGGDPYEGIFEEGIPIPKELQFVPVSMPIPALSRSPPTVAVTKSRIPTPTMNGNTTQTSIATAGTSRDQSTEHDKPKNSQTTKLAKYTISADEFFEGAIYSWNRFYGDSKQEMPENWYSTFASQFAGVNNVNNAHGIFDTCIEVLLNDQNQLRQRKPYNISVLPQKFHREFGEVASDLNHRRGSKISSGTTAPFEPLMRSNKSLLQHALLKKLNVEQIGSDLKARSVAEIPSPNEWAPNFCLFPFHAFQAHAQWYMQQYKEGELNLNDVHPDIMKLRYVEYMDTRGRKPQQLIRGIFSAYEHHVLNFPIRVLQLLYRRKLLEPSTRLFSVIASLGNVECDYINVFQVSSTPTHERRYSTPSPIIMQYPLLPTPAPPISILGPLPMPTVKPSPLPLLSMNVKSQPVVKIGSNAGVPLPSWSPNQPRSTAGYSTSTSSSRTSNSISDTEMDSGANTISAQEFFACVEPCWNRFYGENEKKLPPNWHSRYKTQYPEPNNNKDKDKNGILVTCIGVILADHERFGNLNMPVISYLSDVFLTNFNEIEKDLRQRVSPSIQANPKILAPLMRNNGSLLQMALVDPIELDPHDRSAPQNAAAVFQPTDWCPSRSVFPFPAFVAHLKWHLSQKNTDFDTSNLDIEVLKLRFVEYISIFMTNTNQFILALFTAYGPNVLDYPVRILEILKQRQLLRRETKLFQVINNTTGAPTYSKISIGPKPANGSPNVTSNITVESKIENTDSNVPTKIDIWPKAESSNTNVPKKIDAGSKTETSASNVSSKIDFWPKAESSNTSVPSKIDVGSRTETSTSNVSSKIDVGSKTETSTSNVPSKIDIWPRAESSNTNVPSKIDIWPRSEISNTNVPSKIDVESKTDTSTSNGPIKIDIWPKAGISNTNVPSKIDVESKTETSTSNGPIKIDITIEIKVDKKENVNAEVKMADAVVQGAINAKPVQVTSLQYCKPSAPPILPAPPLKIINSLTTPVSSSSPLPSTSNGNISSLSYKQWRQGCEQALSEMRQDGNIPTNIPDVYFEELFESYKELAIENDVANLFDIFVLGVWTGTHLRDFDPEWKSSFRVKDSS